MYNAVIFVQESYFIKTSVLVFEGSYHTPVQKSAWEEVWGGEEVLHYTPRV